MSGCNREVVHAWARDGSFSSLHIARLVGLDVDSQRALHETHAAMMLLFCDERMQFIARGLVRGFFSKQQLRVLVGNDNAEQLWAAFWIYHERITPKLLCEIADGTIPEDVLHDLYPDLAADLWRLYAPRASHA